MKDNSFSKAQLNMDIKDKLVVGTRIKLSMGVNKNKKGTIIKDLKKGEFQIELDNAECWKARLCT